MKKLAFVFLSVLMCIHAGAQEELNDSWIDITGGKDVRYEFNVDNIRRDGDKVYVWLRTIPLTDELKKRIV